MTVEFTMPQLGESVVEGTVGKWLKQVGDAVQEYEPLLEVTTDKVETEIPSPVTGVLLEIRAQEGETVQVGHVIAVFSEAGQEPESPPAPATLPTTADVAEMSSSEVGAGKRPAGRQYLTPVVARMAAEHDVDLSQVEGTGRQGRITKKDMVRYLEARAARPSAREAVSPPAPLPAARAPAAVKATPSAPALTAGDQVVPLSKMRQAIVHHMRQSKDTAAHVTTFFEADLSRVVAFRQTHKVGFAAEGIHLTYTPFFLEAIVAGLKAFPMLNSVLDGDSLIYKRAINIGLAVDLGEEGLIVPVLKHVDGKNLRGLAREVADLAQRARSGSLTPDDVQGGTFTLTNHGVIGSLAATPIIPMPQVAILGVGAIQKRPVVVESDLGDTIAIRPMAYLSLSFDHRAIDGATADRFMVAAKAYLENYGCDS